MDPSNKIMFEIYFQTGHPRKYRVIYFTELDEHARDVEISLAMDGEHLFDAFINEQDAPEAKEVITALIGRLNNGEPWDEDRVHKLLQPYLAD